MAGDNSKNNTRPVPKSETLSKGKTTPDAVPSKAAGGEKDADLSSSYNRGESQKPVSKAYKDNWSRIFAKKKKR